MNTQNHKTPLSRRQFIGVAGTAALATLLPSAAVKVLAQQQTGEKVPLTADWRIVVAQNATKQETFAAEELQHYIEKLIGFKLTIEPSDSAAPARAFVIGRHPALQQYAEKLDNLHGARPDSFAVIANAGFIGMVGVTPIATCYAVWEWLENLGVRWIFPTPKGEYVPQLTQIATVAGENYFTPAVNQRWIWPFATSTQANPELFGELEHGIPAWNLFQCRMRSWGNTNHISPEDRVANIGMGHSYFRFLPADKYFNDHPEWFNLLKGKRVSTTRENVQVCFTNEDAAKEFARNLITEVRRVEAADYNLRRMRLCVMPNDSHAMCECENCRKLVDKDGSSTSMVVHFTNLVAREVAKTLPDATLLTLAYWNHSTPPDHVKADPNVAVQITQWPSGDSFHFNNAKPGLTEQGNAKFFNAYKKWSEMCSNVFVYQYYGHYIWWTPFPMRTQMDFDLKRHVQNPSFKGFNCEYRTQWMNQAIGMVMLAKLGWDVEQDVHRLQADYCKHAFGPAGELMNQYYDVLQAAMDKNTRLGGNIWHLNQVYNRAVIDQCNDLIGQVTAMMPQMDEGTRWRTDLVTTGWRMTSAFSEAILLLYQKPSLANLQKMRAGFETVRTFAQEDPRGPLLIEPVLLNSPGLNGSLIPYTNPFMVPLEALPAGKHSYIDKMYHGGPSKFHATLTGIKTEEWGHRATAGKGLYTIPIKAAAGHCIKSLKVTVRSIGTEKVVKHEATLTTANGDYVFAPKPFLGKAIEIPANLLDCPQATLKIEIENLTTTEPYCLNGLEFEVEVV